VFNWVGIVYEFKLNNLPFMLNEPEEVVIYSQVNVSSSPITTLDMGVVSVEGLVMLTSHEKLTFQVLSMFLIITGLYPISYKEHLILTVSPKFSVAVEE
jgi:hypothetical protein